MKYVNFTNKCGLLLALIPGLLLTSPLAAKDDNFSKATGKKLIELGWDKRTAEYVRDNIREMEKRPFEGIVFHLPNKSDINVFDLSQPPSNKKEQQEQFEILADIKWDRFTDNFLIMKAASTMDWYSDSDWKKVLSKVAFSAKAAKTANCVGLVFDPEPYGSSPWHYAKQKHADKYSFDQYSVKVYERGQQFMRAMQGQIPDVKVLSLMQYQLFYAWTRYFPFDTARRETRLAAISYSLYRPFLNGMLSVINKNAQLIDGNEGSYYYETPEDYYQGYWDIRNGGRLSVPTNLKRKYETNVKAANALYVDYIFGRVNLENSRYAKAMTPTERAQWFEQNVYYSLRTSDEYVWLYSEKMNWWTDRNLPTGMLDAVLSARSKLEKSEQLGHSMNDIIAKLEKNK